MPRPRRPMTSVCYFVEESAAHLALVQYDCQPPIPGARTLRVENAQRLAGDEPYVRAVIPARQTFTALPPAVGYFIELAEVRRAVHQRRRHPTGLASGRLTGNRCQ